MGEFVDWYIAQVRHNMEIDCIFICSLCGFPNFGFDIKPIPIVEPSSKLHTGTNLFSFEGFVRAELFNFSKTCRFASTIKTLIYSFAIRVVVYDDSPFPASVRSAAKELCIRLSFSAHGFISSPNISVRNDLTFSAA